MWNIRKIVKKGKYLYAVVPEHPKATKYGYVLIHRVIMENKIGRLLDDKEEVHHVNEDTHDNAEENLEIKWKGEHQSYHNKLKFPNGRKMVKLICAYCEKEFEREARQAASKKHYKNNFCSRKCSGRYNGFQPKPL